MTKDLRTTILQIASAFVGIKEIPPNMGFDNKEFERLMRGVGWRPGMAWCNLASEVVWNLAYKTDYIYQYDEIKVRLDKLFSANSQACYLSFEDSEFETSQDPEPGDIGIYRHPGKKSGHTLIVKKVYEDFIETYEGNISDAFKENKRKIKGFSGMVLMGFIKPKIY